MRPLVTSGWPCRGHGWAACGPSTAPVEGRLDGAVTPPWPACGHRAASSRRAAGERRWRVRSAQKVRPSKREMRFEGLFGGLCREAWLVRAAGSVAPLRRALLGGLAEPRGRDCPPAAHWHRDSGSGPTCTRAPASRSDPRPWTACGRGQHEPRPCAVALAEQDHGLPCLCRHRIVAAARPAGPQYIPIQDVRTGTTTVQWYASPVGNAVDGP
jgi:hypothetical protein